MLTGTELLAKVKDLGEASKTKLVRATGYVSTKEDGSERLNFTAFYEALLEARGIHLGPARGDGAPGRKLSYVTHVLFNGNLLIGKAYTAQLGLQPGDPFQIQLGRRQIRLHPLDPPTIRSLQDRIRGLLPPQLAAFSRAFRSAFQVPETTPSIAGLITEQRHRAWIQQYLAQGLGQAQARTA
jgi:hypothetical protein